MDYGTVAAQVLTNVGGTGNIGRAITCLTRLRLTLKKIDLADLDAIRAQAGVLGVVMRNHDEIEIVFGPNSIEPVAKAFKEQSGISLDVAPDVLSQSSAYKYVAQKDAEEHEARKAAEIKQGATAPLYAYSDTPPETYQMSAGRKKSYRAQQKAAINAGRLVKEDLESLKSFLVESGGALKHTRVKEGKSVLVINGPNLNMLGVREPEHYGSQNYAALVDICKAAAAEAGFADCKVFQSNHEGALVDEIQNALGQYDGIVMNPAAYTHTSVAILDAVKAVQLPCVEVHISKVEDREDFRQLSYVRAACFETITGLGLEGYRKAILDLANHLGM